VRAARACRQWTRVHLRDSNGRNFLWNFVIMGSLLARVGPAESSTTSSEPPFVAPVDHKNFPIKLKTVRAYNARGAALLGRCPPSATSRQRSGNRGKASATYTCTCARTRVPASLYSRTSIKL